MVTRHLPNYRNSFKPYFFGRFVSAPAGVRLEGVFTEHWAVKLFLTFWVAMASIPAIAMLVTSQSGSPMLIAFPAFGVILNYVGRALSRGDIRFIADALDAALS